MEFRYIRFKRLWSGKIRNFRYVLEVIDNFSKFGWTVPLKNKTAQTIKGSSENILASSKRNPDLAKTDRDRGFYIDVYQNFINIKNIELYSRKTSLGAVSAERFNRTIRGLPKKSVFEQGDGNWIDILPTITKQ